MEFSEFAQALSPFYTGEKTQWDFAKELLLQITDNKDAILKYRQKGKWNERSEKTFTSYYTGERSIRPIVKKICDELKPEKFLAFLRSKEFNNNDKDELCKIFGKYFPELSINENNIFSIIAEVFVDIIKESCQSTDTKTTKNIKSGDLYADQQKSDVDLLIRKLKEAVDSLITIGQRIASRKSRLPWNDIITTQIPQKLDLKLNEAYDELSRLYDEIDNYNSDNNIEFLSKALTLIAQITKESFVETKDEFKIVSSKNYLIHDLLLLVQEYQK